MSKSETWPDPDLMHHAIELRRIAKLVDKHLDNNDDMEDIHSDILNVADSLSALSRPIIVERK